MVAVKRKVLDVIADPAPASSSNSLHSNSLDRRTKAIRSCSNWNSALLHGRRTRGPQWDYATASYHVSKGSTEYYKGVTRIESGESNPTATSNPSSAPNHYALNPSSQFPPGFQSRATLNIQVSGHPHQHPHTFQQDPEQFQNRLIRHSSQHSQGSSHGRPMGNPAQPTPYSIHPAHLQLAGMPQQAFNNLPNPSDPKSAMFTTPGANYKGHPIPQNTGKYERGPG
ncbi:hypothetical protein PGT21_027248 [Puccinia graminis f. sp. tritici]|uniref:Uncharacterized protein n=2 Tax=Puccinia graminis f. sp. tritici TaxID=56615 RepID=E3KTT5_PUCGT|nr:uncharacterized protein PGTG_13436 [Puccinia graminis f. sp. tritici CRL 75-36-700-3]EFP87650.1 hypothetical protein PGTG_13436 [Puccinia graminis f. sp. tritici CRL 75-36-700-3]KAA1101663.1 hypothetical protein PGT21_027248 [Puccinia graminis f. sp. tritici]KAA1136309.1 hypothetical protein PGTUg99_022127 [Puccinia graminis f. sp. tritici]